MLPPSQSRTEEDAAIPVAVSQEPVGIQRTAVPGRVVMLVPGGLEHAGGIGRWAGYMQAAWDRQALQPPMEILDTRSVGNPARALVAFTTAILRLIALHATGRLGTVHANLSKRGSTARKLLVSILSAATGMRLVIHLHGSGYDAFYRTLPGFWQRRVAAMFRRADATIVLGRFWSDWVIAELGVPRDRVHILNNGVPRPEPRDRIEGPCRILLLGRLGPRKGVPELLAALTTPALRARPWTATLAGDGEIDTYRQRVDQAGMTDRIALLGWLDATATADLLAQADILVLPSHAENFPISIIEALAARVAVIATPVGATPELLRHDESALFVPVGDIPALAAALTALIDDPPRRAAIAAAGHAVFEQKLDIDALARRLAALHASFLPKPTC